MKLATILIDEKVALAAIDSDGNARAVLEGQPGYPGDVGTVVARGGDALAAAGKTAVGGAFFEAGRFQYLPVVRHPAKTIWVGLNYSDHAAEGGFDIPEFPTIFSRFSSSLIGHGAALLVPPESDKFDYEVELAVAVGKGGRRIPKSTELDHVAGYSIFNDASVRVFHLRTPQWTVGKNFDHTGAFGPYLVRPDEVPTSASNLKIETRIPQTRSRP